MTDRFNGLVVTLERDIREDDAESLIAAIKHMRGVANVAGNVSDLESHLAYERARHEMATKLWDVVFKGPA